ncbi:MAG: CHRD domain-containing protein [Sphingorhabdus sp.]
MYFTKFAAISSSALLASLALSGCATVKEAVGEAVAETRYATLSGSQVVSSRGDPDGYAKAELTVSDELNQVCYDINDARGLAEITSVTINRGAPGMTGPVVLRLREANEGGWKNCVKKSEWQEDSFENSPSAYFVQIATVEYPNGAIRGQFSKN